MSALTKLKKSFLESDIYYQATPRTDLNKLVTWDAIYRLTGWRPNEHISKATRERDDE